MDARELFDLARATADERKDRDRDGLSVDDAVAALQADGLVDAHLIRGLVELIWAQQAQLTRLWETLTGLSDDELARFVEKIAPPPEWPGDQ